MWKPPVSLTIPTAVRTPFLVSYLFAAVTSFMAVVFYTQLPPVIPLFYTLAQPIDQLAVKEWIFLFPLLAVLVGFTHTIVVEKLNEHGKVMIRLFAFSTVVVQLILLLSCIRIIFIVG